MKVLHITPSTNGYEEVELIANSISKTNNLAAIRKNGEVYYTGGFLINDTPQIRKVLDSIPVSDQYEFAKSFKMTPFESFKRFEEMDEYNQVLENVSKKVFTNK
jgi:hypothetical protein